MNNEKDRIISGLFLYIIISLALIDFFLPNFQKLINGLLPNYKKFVHESIGKYSLQKTGLCKIYYLT